MTISDQLNEINNAISAILGGAQEYTIGSRRIRRAELSTLINERRRLEAMLANENGQDTFIASLGQR